MIPSYKAYLIKKHMISPQVLEITFYVPELKSDLFIPGQYFVFLIKDADKIYRRPYSVVRLEQENIIFAAALVEGGLASKFLQEMQLNECCEIIGPLGEFILRIEKPIRKLVLVGTSTGIVPYIPMLNNIAVLQNEGCIEEIHIILGIEKRSHIIYQQIFEDFVSGDALHRNFYVCLSQEQPQNHHLMREYYGYVQIPVKQLALDNRDQIYLCGNYDMIKETSLMLQSNNMPHIYLEKYY